MINENSLRVWFHLVLEYTEKTDVSAHRWPELTHAMFG